ncbi:MAG: nucleotide exchange factor GrpE [Bacteroidota bacterium]
MKNHTDEKEELNKDTTIAESTTPETAGDESKTPSTDEDQGAGAQEEMVKMQAELAAAKDKYIRLYSEFENFRRRTAKEKLDLVQSANEQLIRALLAVADDFERAEKSFKEKNDKDAEGFFLIQNKFKKVLEQYGVKPMDLQKGTDFNPDFHEAITQIETPEELSGKVADVVEKGYLLNEKVIRFAKVVVGK